MTFHFAELSLPLTSDPSPALVAISGISSQVALETLGVDLADTADTLAAKYGSQDSIKKVYIVALAATPRATEQGELGLPLIASSGQDSPADVLGYAWLGLPLTDNQHLIDVSIEVAPTHRGRGIGTALWQLARKVAAMHSRRTVVVWSEHAPTAPGTDTLRPPTGFGHIPRDRTSSFLLRQGFRLEQVERHSYLELPVPADRLATLRHQLPDNPDYRVLAWEGVTPPQHLTHMARLREAMSTDVPTAALEIEQERWDEARLATWDTVATTGLRKFTTAIEHVPTGHLVAFTEIGQVLAKPAHAFQDATLVVTGHRGHKLGMVSKLANLAYVTNEVPEVTAIHTWNAGENNHMLAINHALGFQEGGSEGAWELKL